EPPVEPEEPEDPEDPMTVTFVETESDWAYLFSNEAPDDEWMADDFDEEGWSTGAAPLGWGHANLGTTLEAESPKPVVSLYRTTFEIEEGTELDEVEITTRADDGLVLWVNGVEVERVRIDPGEVRYGTWPTYANAAVGASTALANPVTVTVPADTFKVGTNVITASVHSNYRSSPSHSFELEAIAILG